MRRAVLQVRIVIKMNVFAMTWLAYHRHVILTQVNVEVCGGIWMFALTPLLRKRLGYCGVWRA
jgi:hypothetical protein